MNSLRLLRLPTLMNIYLGIGLFVLSMYNRGLKLFVSVSELRVDFFVSTLWGNMGTRRIGPIIILSYLVINLVCVGVLVGISSAESFEGVIAALSVVSFLILGLAVLLRLVK